MINQMWVRVKDGMTHVEAIIGVSEAIMGSMCRVLCGPWHVMFFICEKEKCSMWRLYFYPFFI